MANASGGFELHDCFVYTYSSEVKLTVSHSRGCCCRSILERQLKNARQRVLNVTAVQIQIRIMEPQNKMLSSHELKPISSL